MTRRHRVAHVLPRQYVVPSIGPPKTEAEIAREHCLPLCRVRPATPKTLEVLTTSEASLAASGLDFLVRVLVRPNATPEMSPCARLSLRRFTKKPTRSDLFQLVECSVEADSDEEISTTAGFQTPDLETPNIQTPGLQSYRSQSSESQIEMTPPPRKSKIQFFTPEKQLPSSAKPLPLSRQATSTSSPKQRKARFSIQEEEADGFGELVRLDTFENNVPYVPLRLFLDDWEERPNGTLRVGKLKRTISELMNGQAKIAALGDQILGDLSVSISHLNLAQLITFRAAQPVVPDACGNDALNSILARLDDFISETLINHAMSKRMAPTLEAMESMGGRELQIPFKYQLEGYFESSNENKAEDSNRRNANITSYKNLGANTFHTIRCLRRTTSATVSVAILAQTATFKQLNKPTRGIPCLTPRLFEPRNIWEKTRRRTAQMKAMYVWKKTKTMEKIEWKDLSPMKAAETGIALKVILCPTA